MAYVDLAPTLDSVGLTQEELYLIFDNMPTPPSPISDPSISKTQVENIITAACSAGSLAGQGGLSKLAQGEGLTTSQVKTILSEMNSVLTSYLNQG